MEEPDVALTDYILALECISFAYYFLKRSSSFYAKLWFLFFFSFALAGVLGGTSHGFYNGQSLVALLIWRVTLVLSGVNIVTICALIWNYQYGKIYLKHVMIFLILFFVLFTGTILIKPEFHIVIAFYAPLLIISVIFCFLKYYLTRNKYFLWLCIGWLLHIAAAITQGLRLALNPIYFNHNSTAHIIQMIALAFIFYAAKQLENYATDKNLLG